HFTGFITLDIVCGIMLSFTFRRIYRDRFLESARLLGTLPLTDVNRLALSAAAHRAALEAILGSCFPFVGTLYDIGVLASRSSGPGIPEGAVRLRALRAAILRVGEAAGSEGGEAVMRAGTGEPTLPGCPYARVIPSRGRLPISAAAVERARISGMGLCILRFKPSGLRRSPRALVECLANLGRQGCLLGLYAITGRRPVSAAREFAMLVTGLPKAPGKVPAWTDPLAEFPASGRLRLLLAAGQTSDLDLSGFLLMGDAVETVETARPAGRPARRET
ncbi:MAG TPA: hypothetical protein VLH39_07620, partial [Magnetospirillaceae bacterium]|nr:hypothetical protein [Magnetospirillaceae bacterium]